MSHVMDNQLTILKRDARGRVRSTTEARAEAVAEFRRSGEKDARHYGNTIRRL